MPLFDRPLPDPLCVLRELALDLHWSWNHDSDQLWRQINEDIWTRTQNPVDVLNLTSDERLHALANDMDFVGQLNALIEARHTYLNEPSWYQRQYPQAPIEGIAYLSMEFGLCDALPLYAGGLGMLAGDYLKTASDLGVPLIGVGLFYQEGYFHQSFNDDGRQQETYLFNDPGSLPLKPLRAEDGSWLHIDTEFLCRRVRFRVWQVQVGRVTLYLLDSNDPRNRAADRSITSKLYGGSTELRLVQEIALGICGWRLVEELGLHRYVCHLNEGHAAFATLERIRCYRQRHHCSFDEALWATRGGNLFTTHTPVEAGFDRYPPQLLRRYIAEFAHHLDVSLEQLMALGRAQPDNDQEPFNMAYLATNTCAYSNGVSELHGRVSQRIFQSLFPRWPEREVPVGHVTNGVHVPTWDSDRVDGEWERLFGKNRWRQDLAEMSPTLFDQLEDKRLWHMAGQDRARLVDYARVRLSHQWRREAGPGQCTVYAERPLDPNLLTIGFARRFAQYKRPALLLSDPERLARLLNHARHPVQLLIAGKAHPADDWGKNALQTWHHFAQRADVRHRVVLLEDYDIELAQHLIQGVDLWLNTPRRPWEASGTSGMKTLVNGGLNLSILDGWWAEAYQPGLGWALGQGEEHRGEKQSEEQDARDAEQLYQLLEQEIAPLFYQRDKDNLPREWLKRMRASMAQLTPQFSCNRMIHDYIERYYLQAGQSIRARQAGQGELARELYQWQETLRQHWHEIHIGDLQFEAAGEHQEVSVNIYLGGIGPEAVRVQLIADPRPHHDAITLDLELSHPLEGSTHAYRYQGRIPTTRAPEDFTPRVIAHHPDAHLPAENRLIAWPD